MGRPFCLGAEYPLFLKTLALQALDAIAHREEDSHQAFREMTAK